MEILDHSEPLLVFVAGVVSLALDALEAEEAVLDAIDLDQLGFS